MRRGLSYDLKEAVPLEQDGSDDALEEYDSLETVDFIAVSLEVKGHSVVRLGGGNEFLDNIRREKMDIVFNIAEGRGNYRSREAQVPSVLEMLDIPYSGSDPQCLAICLDKPLTKQLVAAAGVPTPRWTTVRSAEDLQQVSWHDFCFPLIIKPAHEGSSMGIRISSIVDTPQQGSKLTRKLLSEYHQPVMLEEFISGDEVTVGIIGNEILGVMRITPRQKNRHFVYSLEVKRDYEALVDYECPAQLDEEVTREINRFSKQAFRVLGCRDFARVDYRIGSDGTPYFIEINPLPGLGTYSDLVIMAQKLSWTHQGLIRAVLEAAIKRYPQWARV